MLKTKCQVYLYDFFNYIGLNLYKKKLKEFPMVKGKTFNKF